MEPQGFVAPGFERVAEAFAANFEAGEELGAGFAAFADGEAVVDIWGGFADRAKTRPWTRGTLAAAHSTTKGVAALVAAHLVDEGALSYEDRVADLWPAFAAHSKGGVTIAQAFSHQAGIPGFADKIDPELWLDPEACAAGIAALTPLWPPGTASGYHPITWGYIIGEVVRRASGRSLGAILRDDICAPSGVDFHIGLPESEDARVADSVKPKRIADFGTITDIKRAAFLLPWATPPRDDERWRRIEVPSANGYGTARAIAQLYGAFADGQIAGKRVLSAQARAQAATRRIIGDDLVLPFTLDWRSGVLGNAQGFYGPSPDALGHSGAGGSCGFADPSRRISGGYVMNKQSHFLMGDPRCLRLIEALYACLG